MVSNSKTPELEPVQKKNEEQVAFRTDSQIAQNRPEIAVKELEAWEPSEDVPYNQQLELENSDAQVQWDQFEVNSRRFRVKSTYQEDMYTTPLDVTTIPKAVRDAADKIAREIEISRTRHISDDEEDEEAKYAAVQRPEKTTQGSHKEPQQQQQQQQLMKSVNLRNDSLQPDQKSQSKFWINELIKNSRNDAKLLKSKWPPNSLNKQSFFKGSHQSFWQHQQHIVKNINALNLEPAILPVKENEPVFTLGDRNVPLPGRCSGVTKVSREKEKTAFLEDLNRINERLKNIDWATVVAQRKYISQERIRLHVNRKIEAESKAADMSRHTKNLVDFPIFNNPPRYREPIDQILLKNCLPQCLKEKLDHVQPVWNSGIHPSVPRLNSYLDILTQGLPCNIQDTAIDTYGSQRNSFSIMPAQRPKQVMYPASFPVVYDPVMQGPQGYPQDPSMMQAVDPSWMMMILHPSQQQYPYTQQTGQAAASTAAAAYYPQYMYSPVYMPTPQPQMYGQQSGISSQGILGKTVPVSGYGMNPNMAMPLQPGADYMYPPPHTVAASPVAPSSELPESFIRPQNTSGGSQMSHPPNAYGLPLQQPRFDATRNGMDMYGKYVANGNVHILAKHHPASNTMMPQNFYPQGPSGSPVYVDEPNTSAGPMLAVNNQSMGSTYSAKNFDSGNGIDESVNGQNPSGNGNNSHASNGAIGSTNQGRSTTGSLTTTSEYGRVNAANVETNGNSAKYANEPLSPPSPSAQMNQRYQHFYSSNSSTQNGPNIYFIPPGMTLFAAPQPPLNSQLKINYPFAPPPPQASRQSIDQNFYNTQQIMPALENGVAPSVKWHDASAAQPVLSSHTLSTSMPTNDESPATPIDSKPVMIYDPMVGSGSLPMMNSENNGMPPSSAAAPMYTPPSTTSSCMHLPTGNMAGVNGPGYAQQGMDPYPQSVHVPSRGPSPPQMMQRYMHHPSQISMPGPGGPTPQRNMIAMPLYPSMQYFTSPPQPPTQQSLQQPLNQPVMPKSSYLSK